MPDVQVSNARRVVFTAMAVVALWIAAWRMYEIVATNYYDSVGVMRSGPEPFMNLVAVYPWCCFVAVSIAIIPTGFLSLSTHNSPLRSLRDPWLVVSGILFASSVFICMWLGATDVMACIDSIAPEGRTFDELRPVVVQARSQHHVSWLWLLLPLILTTAFVIYGAWRSAVRDAEAATGEDDVRLW